MHLISTRKIPSSLPVTTRKIVSCGSHRQEVEQPQALCGSRCHDWLIALLRPRLCERGCGFVTVTTSFVWDMHADINNAPMSEGMGYVGAPFDHAVAALIDDIEAHGLSDKILLVCCGEMGRTPTVNNHGGRDHWGNLAPLLLYGGGLKMGQVIGAIDARDGGQPSSDPSACRTSWQLS